MIISKLLRPATVAVTALFLLYGPAGAKMVAPTEPPLPAVSGGLDKAKPLASTKLAQRRRFRRRGFRRRGFRRGFRGRRGFRRRGFRRGRFRRHRHHGGFYFGLPYYYPYYYGYPRYYYRRPYRRRYGRRCGYWHDRCVANWGYRNSNYYGCMKYHRCR